MRWVTATVLVCVLAGCSTSVTGAAVGDSAATTTTETTETTETTTTTTTTTTTEHTPLPPPPTSVDQNAAQRYCAGTITGALAKPMNVVVVATAGGRVNCEEASAVLVHYYEERPEPDPASAPIEVDGYACNQVPEPDLPQVICADDVSLFYSMWVQGG
ncbi:hypothetical protein [Actinophytocola glycyrrhizae]|uniref:Subtilisin inhibitor-like n=1 Tax=Actinophytocola glycyrrhizae TaxID=2044873 RepID=A0ABV9S4D1_9PSEU